MRAFLAALDDLQVAHGRRPPQAADLAKARAGAVRAALDLAGLEHNPLDPTKKVSP